MDAVVIFRDDESGNEIQVDGRRCLYDMYVIVLLNDG